MQTIRHVGAAAILAAAIPLGLSSALAHVTLEASEAPAAANYKAVVRVPHGCKGQATHTVRVQVPDGLLGVKPMPKAGWTLSTQEGAYAATFDLYGKPVTTGVKEIVWSGGDLADAHYDEFVFRAYVSGTLAGKSVAIPVIQDCAGGSERWIEIAAPGEDPHALKSPAPVLRVAAGTGAATSISATSAGTLRIEAPWIRATPGGAQVAGGFMRITNTGSEPDRLIGGSMPRAGRFEVHEMSMFDGVMRMKPLDKGLTIAPGQTVELKPGGYHIMFLDLKEPMKDGDSVTGTLVFEKAGTIAITSGVQPIGARGADPQGDAGAKAHGTHKH